jgi:glycogen operon protein
LITLLTAPVPERDPSGIGRAVLLLVNATPEAREFILPPVAKATRWRLFFDTAASPPADIYPDLDGPPPPESQRIALASRSLCCYVEQNSLPVAFASDSRDSGLEEDD